jgi:hypothetical protein
LVNVPETTIEPMLRLASAPALATAIGAWSKALEAALAPVPTPESLSAFEKYEDTDTRPALASALEIAMETLKAALGTQLNADTKSGRGIASTTVLKRSPVLGECLGTAKSENMPGEPVLEAGSETSKSETMPVAPALDASSFFCLSARFMLLGSFFTWAYFLLEPFFFFLGAGPVTAVSENLPGTSALEACPETAKAEKILEAPLPQSSPGATTLTKARKSNLHRAQ